MIRPLAALVIIAGLLAGTAPAAPVPKGKPAGYFPVTVGDTREYEVRAGGEAEPGYTDAVTRADKQPDGSTHVTVTRKLPGLEPHTQVIAVSGGGLSLVADGGRPLAKPSLLLKLPAAVGTKWESGGSRYEVTAVEEVAVAAGKYQAVKLEATAGGTKTALWYAPGVGLMKAEVPAGGDRTHELKAFKPGK